MKATVFKDVPVRFWHWSHGRSRWELGEPTQPYQQLMDRVGTHMAEGGAVVFDQRINPDPPGVKVPYELIDCTLWPPEGA